MAFQPNPTHRPSPARFVAPETRAGIRPHRFLRRLINLIPSLTLLVFPSVSWAADSKTPNPGPPPTLPSPSPTLRSNPPVRSARKFSPRTASFPTPLTPTNSLRALTNLPTRLNLGNIVALAYERNPTVRAAREEMKAAKHALVEFRSNLNRLEPFVELRSDLSDFPNRRGAFGNTVESVVGVRKETFEGAVLSTEVGGSYSRFEFDRSLVTGETIEAGAGALFRSRIEMPFFGSRRRQDRIIAQAFQESTARKAQLDYLKAYRSVVDNALSYFNLVVYYQELVEVYERWIADLDELAKDPRIKESDRHRIESVRASSVSYRGQYSARREEYWTILLSYLAMDENAQFDVEVPEYRLSEYAQQARDPSGLQRLIERARTNNPAFRVLSDAIRNTELQRQQAIRGKYDVTTFLEGTHFPLGSATFDNRFDGWTIGGGVNIRLNDRRVRNATREKAESQIRQFESEIEAEEINIRRRIVSTTKAIWDNDENRKQMLDVSRRKATEFQERLKEYFADEVNIDQLLGSRADIASNGSNLANNLYNTADREASLMLAIGQIYEMVGLSIDSNDASSTGKTKNRSFVRPKTEPTPPTVSPPP